MKNDGGNTQNHDLAFICIYRSTYILTCIAIPHTTHTHIYAYAHMQRNYRTVEQSRHMLTLCKNLKYLQSQIIPLVLLKFCLYEIPPKIQNTPPHTHHKLTDFENIYSCHTPKEGTLRKHMLPLVISDNWL